MSSTVGEAALENHHSDHDMDIIRQQKQRLRKEVRSRLRALNATDIATQSRMVWERLWELPAYQAARSVGLFLSMPSGEINTELALRHAVQHGKDIYVPQVGRNFESADMELLKVPAKTTTATTTTQSNSDDSNNHEELFYHAWPRNKWGIPEPPPDLVLQPAQPGDLDVLIVPGLAFDRKGDRLGQGKGYYDRFIQRMSTSSSSGTLGDKVASPVLIAVGLDCQLVDCVPTQEYDRRMDLILLPSTTIEPSSSTS